MKDPFIANSMQAIRENNNGVDDERPFRPHRAKCVSQQPDVSHQHIGTTIPQRHRKEIRPSSNPVPPI